MSGHQYFVRYNANPWNKRLPDCAIRSVALATGLPYVDVCKKLGVSFEEGHGLLKDDDLYLRQIKNAFDDYFDFVITDVDEKLNPKDVPDIDFDTASLFDDEEAGFVEDRKGKLNLIEWMELYRGQGVFLVALMNPTVENSGHIVCVSTNNMHFYDTWDCSDWKVFAWMRVKKRNSGHKAVAS